MRRPHRIVLSALAAGGALGGAAAAAAALPGHPVPALTAQAAPAGGQSDDGSARREAIRAALADLDRQLAEARDRLATAEAATAPVPAAGTAARPVPRRPAGTGTAQVRARHTAPRAHAGTGASGHHGEPPEHGDDND